jgi:hypothetical protein
MTARHLCTDPTHKDTPALAVNGDPDNRRQCPICYGERLAFTPVDEDLDLLTHGEEKPVAAFTVETRPDPYGAPGLALGPFYAPLAYADETHVHTDAQLRSAVDGVNAIVERQVRARAEQREARAREWLTARVREKIALSQEGHLGIDRRFPNAVEDALDVSANAAVEVFLEFLRNPPVREHHPDGTETVRWPGDETVRRD